MKRIIRYIAVAGFSCLFAGNVLLARAQTVELVTKAEREVEVVEKGVKVKKLAPPDKMLPGDEVVYTVTYIKQHVLGGLEAGAGFIDGRKNSNEFDVRMGLLQGFQRLDHPIVDLDVAGVPGLHDLETDHRTVIVTRETTGFRRTVADLSDIGQLDEAALSSRNG